MQGDFSDDSIDSDDQEEGGSGSGSEEQEDSDGDAGGAGGAKRQKKPERETIYDIDGLHDKLEDIGWVEGAGWEETLVITNEDPAQVQDVDDDLARELAFYNQVPNLWALMCKGEAQHA